MKIDQFYHQCSLSCRLDDRLADAAVKMYHAEMGSLAVVDDHDRVVGIVTERALARAVADQVDPGAVKVAAYATDGIAPAGIDEDSAQVARRMLDAEIRHLPVVERGRLVGVVSMRNLLAVYTWL